MVFVNHSELASWLLIGAILACLRLVVRLAVLPQASLVGEVKSQPVELVLEVLGGPCTLAAVVLFRRQVATDTAVSFLTSAFPEAPSAPQLTWRLDKDRPGFLEEVGVATVDFSVRQSRFAAITASLLGLLSMPLGGVSKAFAQDGKTPKGGKTTTTQSVKIDDQPPQKVKVRRSVETMVMGISSGPVTTVVSNLVSVEIPDLQGSLRSNLFSTGYLFNQMSVGPAQVPVNGVLRVDNRAGAWAGLTLVPPVGRDASLAITALKGLGATPDRLEVNATVNLPKTPLGLRGMMFMQEGRAPDAWAGPTVKLGGFQFWVAPRITGRSGFNTSVTITY